MPAKIRLQRQGRKFQAIYSIVVADSRAPRDGKFIELLGQYNPNTNPATIVLDFNKALEWLQKGAQPTDTCRAILSYKGVLYKKHLLEGVKKGAFSEEEAEKRFQAWMTEKEQKIQAKKDRLKSTEQSLLKNRLEVESKIRETRAEEIAKKRSKLIAAEEAAADEEAPAEEAEASEEAAVAEEAPVAEAPVAEEAVAEEAVAEEVAAEEETPAAEAPAEEAAATAEAPAEETPAEEPVAEEAAAEEAIAEEAPVEEIPAEEPVADQAAGDEPDAGEAEEESKKKE
jgi:small subunit ribosomal protein S16